MIEMSSGLGPTAMGIQINHGSSNEGLTSGCRLRAQSQGQSGGSPSQQSIQFQTEKAGANQQRQLMGRSKKDNCCLCWCCCCSCSLAVGTGSSAGLHSRPAGAGLGSGGSSSVHGTDGDSGGGHGATENGLECDFSKMNVEEIRLWGTSFDRLMSSTAGRALFKEFLVSEYSDENIAFWLACEQLKRESNPEKVEEKAKLIYEDYISIISPKEVSLDSRVRETVNRNMTRPTPHTFDEAQLQIYTLMHRDSYPRFIGSKLYRQVARLDSGNQSPNSTAPPAIERREHGSTGAVSVGSTRSKSKKSFS